MINRSTEEIGREIGLREGRFCMVLESRVTVISWFVIVSREREVYSIYYPQDG